MRRRSILPALSAAALLSACAAIPLETMASLSRFDVTSADPAGLRAAVRLPKGFQLGKEEPILILSAWRDGKGSRGAHTAEAGRQCRDG